MLSCAPRLNVISVSCQLHLTHVYSLCYRTLYEEQLFRRARMLSQNYSALNVRALCTLPSGDSRRNLIRYGCDAEQLRA